MQILFTLFLVAQILSALVMIGLVLVQHGKGADMGASFGSGASGSLFGATGSANFLSRSTAVCATVFFLCTLGLAYVNSHGGALAQAQGSILDQAAASASAPASSAAAIPAATPGAIPTAPAGGIPTAPTSVPGPAAPASPARQ